MLARRATNGCAHMPVDNSPRACFEAINRALNVWEGCECVRRVACGAETMMVPGYEHHTFECSACREVERRPIFTRARRFPSGRVVLIGYDAEQAAYAAKDTKSGLVVMHNQD